VSFILEKSIKIMDFIVTTENPEGEKVIIQKIKELNSGGGGDVCEDLTGAFQLSLNKSWTGFSKFAILATIAPCHGKEYHSPEIEDNYPNGGLEGIDIKEYVKEFAEREIYLFIKNMMNQLKKCLEYSKSFIIK
jgi:hypothetical protein